MSNPPTSSPLMYSCGYVGQLENFFKPCRTSSSSSMSKCPYFTLQTKQTQSHRHVTQADVTATIHMRFRVRPLSEYASYVWSPHLLKDMRQIESVQKRYNKQLVGMSDLDLRLATLGLESLELRRVHHDLLCTYKILSNRIDINYDAMFTVSSQTRSRGHQWNATNIVVLININTFLPGVSLIHGTV